MTYKQQQTLLKLQKTKYECQTFEHPYDILIHAVLNTIDYQSLVKLYINDDERNLRSSLFSNIEKRSTQEYGFEEVYEFLKFDLESGVDFRKSQRIRKVLELLVPELDEIYREDFFRTFFYSKYSADKASSVKYLGDITDEIKEKLMSEYLSSGNLVFLTPLLKPEYSDLLAECVEGIWDSHIFFSTKRRLIDILAKTHLTSLKFLEKIEYDLYLVSLLISKQITPDLAVKQLKKVEKEKRHFALYNISKEVDFQNLEQEINKYVI